ncbi:MAG TPA: hypothetical protein VK504_30570 [Vicinamibacterales bacterium]|jgi:hypothetical protein|nr:hypothetical protein [Vicinamibacterales bacterium]
MFSQDLTLHGGEGYIAWSYHTAAVCRSWTVQRAYGCWTLRAEVTRADPFQLRQQPLEFRMPRTGGFVCWPVMTASLIHTHLAATLGPPVS